MDFNRKFSAENKILLITVIPLNKTLKYSDCYQEYGN